MGFLSFIKGVYRRMFPIKDIQTALNIKPAISSDMANSIDLWNKCYCGKAPWIEKDVHSLKLEKSTTKVFANVILNEMTVNISNERLNKIFKKAIGQLNKKFQRGLATGAMVIKPLGEGSKVQYVAANAFIPLEYDSEGRLLDVIFPDFKQIGDNYYTRLERHKLDENGLTITNTAYVSATPNNLGREIPLSYVDEWKNIDGGRNFPLMKRMAFGYYVNPIDNAIDDSHCGVSIFDDAINSFKKADVQYGRIDWEFESAARKIHADVAAFKNPNTPKLDTNLFVSVDVDSKDEAFFKEFSPELRQDDFIKGLEEYKREIEFAVGLAYGDLSNPQFVEKTATEVITSKQRKYDTVTAIEENLKQCLDDLAYALAFYNSMTLSGYKFTCDFKDSILTDEQAEREEDRKDLANGTFGRDEYRAKWKSEDIETARQNLPDIGEVD